MMPYHVLIADDEYWAIENLRTMIRWEDYGMTLMQPAADGEEALRRMEEHAPELLIADINMPFIDGLSLVRMVRERFPETVCILLTGFGDFEYVRQALRIGVMDYLLKPISSEELSKVLLRAAERFAHEGERQAMRRNDALRTDIARSRMLSGEGGLASDPAQGLLGYHLAVLRMDRQAVPNPFQQPEEIKESLRSVAERTVAFHHVFSPREFILLADGDRAYLQGRLGVAAWWGSIGVSRYTFSSTSFQKAYREASFALSMRTKGGCVLWHEDVAKLSLTERVTAQQEEQLSACLAQRLRSRTEQLILEEIGMAHFAARGWRLIEARRAAERLATVLLRHTGMQSAAALQETEYLQEALFHALEDFDEEGAAELLKDWIALCVPAGAVPADASAREVVHHIVHLIQTDMAQDFSLSALARRFNVESTYLSRVFHQETGDTLMQFIAKARITEACRRMLEQPDKPIMEIAAWIGYLDYAYFNRVFRKIVGISPSAYRQSKEEEE